MQVSLVMPTLNAGELLEEVLEAIDAQPGIGSVEKHAIDSGSSDDTVARLERHGFTVQGIDRREFDHGATRDRMIGQTHGEVIVLLTQDATPADPEWLPRLLATYEDPAVGAAYCRQIPRSDCNPLIRKRILDWTAGRPDRVVQRLAGDPQQAFAALSPMERLQVSAYDNVAGSVRRSAWQQHPFGRRPFGEDVAFGRRLVLGGGSIVFEPRSAVVHSHNRSARAEGKRIYCDHTNLAELFGLVVLPTFAACRAAVQSARAEFQAMLDGLPADEAAPWRQWASDYAWWSAVGTYLGGNSVRLGRGAGWVWFGIVDRWLRRGI